jgi:hypothetical protein
VDDGESAAADSLLALATTVLRESRRTRENYHMIDDELQLPIVAARWLGDPAVPAARKRAFLLEAPDGEPRLHRLLRELALVARMTAPYAAEPVASNLISFAPRDSGWSSASWRDSGAGYAGGRYAMDVNAIWAPHALEAMDRIFTSLRALRIDVHDLAASIRGVRGTPLTRYARDTTALRAAIETWRGAERHFVVSLAPEQAAELRRQRLVAMTAAERLVWSGAAASRDSLTFLAVALDAAGRPIPVANSDPATRLFLGDREDPARASDSSDVEALLRDVRLFVRPYPAGLLVSGVGPVTANDAHAPSPVWRAFERDAYHGPRVVWGREVNLFLLGLSNRLARLPADSLVAPHEEELRSALRRVREAVQAAGFRSELWSYEVRGEQVVPIRYGTGSDVQLWSTSDLAVQFALWRMRGME